VIAAHPEEPRLQGQRQAGEGIRPPVDQIAHREEPVTRGLEIDPVQRRLEQPILAVDVADDEIAAVTIFRMALDHRRSL
jgi:hypothetical protein